MARRLARRRAQRGAALLAMLAVIVLGMSYMLVNSLYGAAGLTNVNRQHNAKVLHQAKQALIGYVAMTAAQATESDPGRLPCPEAPGSFGSPSLEGIASGNCTLPAVGRLPWRTLGLDKLVDAAGEPLWYGVSPGWALIPPGTGFLTINSNTPGQLVVDGVGDTVAVIVAPGPAYSVPAAAGCTAWPQVRPATGTPDPRNYLECENATWPAPDTVFATTGPSSSFNDQVVRVTAAELLPAIEAAVAHRFERDIAPTIRSAYSNADAANPNARWSTTPEAPVLPFAAPFGDPAIPPFNAFTGATGGIQGLLPLTYSETSPNSGAPCSADPRCNPLFVAWTGGTLAGPGINSPSCAVVTGTTTRLDCTFYFTCSLITCTPPSLNFTIQAQAANVGMSLRQINIAANIRNTNGVSTVDPAAIGNVSGVLNSDGSASLTLTGTATPDGSGGILSALLGNLFCGLPILGPLLGCVQSVISVPIGVLADHPIFDTSDAVYGPTYGWFLRNRWHEVSYYTVAANILPSGTRSCVAPPGAPACIAVDYRPDSGKQRGVLAIAGRALSGQSRPPTSLVDWFEGTNANGDAVFAVRSPPLVINRSFNDRIAVIDANP